MRFDSSWAAKTTLLVLLAAGPSAASPSQYGLPDRLPDLTKLYLVSPGSGLSGEARVNTLLFWLAEERHHPSPTVRGTGGGDVDSSWIQQQLIMCLWERGDPDYIERLLAQPRLKPEFSDAMHIALALGGDRRQKESLKRIAMSNPEQAYRYLAVKGLAVINATDAIPLLQAIGRRDSGRYRERGAARIIDSDPATFQYPVRREADRVAAVLLRAEALDYHRKVCDDFDAKMVEARKRRTLLRIEPWVLDVIQSPPTSAKM